jgi:predicted O-linked N-acetylglucosamine transferase (SPINDLY family)
MANYQETLQKAFQFHQKGDFGRAAKLYRKCVKMDPDHFVAHHHLGILEAKAGNLADALTLNDRTIAISPASAEAWLVRGNILAELKRPHEARPAFEKALALNPGDANAFVGLGHVQLELKHPDKALAAYERATTLQPGFVAAWLGLAEALFRLNDLPPALAAYQRALALDGNLAVAWLGSGNALGGMDRHVEALAAFDMALQQDNRLAAAWLGRGNVLYALKRYEEALASYDRARSLDPDLPGVDSAHLRTRMHICDWDDFDRDVAELTAAVNAGKAQVLPFYLIALPSSCEEQLRCARAWMARHYPAAGRPVLKADTARHERINLAYMSADFGQHPVSFATAGLYEQHDRARFHTIGISVGPDDRSDMRRRLTAGFDRFIDAHTKSDEEIAALITELEVDLLIDLSGCTSGARTGVLARRPAPVQVNYLGYAGTMGVDYIDYIIADRFVIPENQRQFYSEKSVWMPNSFFVNDARRGTSDRAFTRKELGLPAAGMVFCCFNNAYKITPRVFDSWMRTLANVSGSVLWLSGHSPTSSANLRKEARTRGVDPQRLVFADAVEDISEHLARCGCADLFLDTLPYNAHASASDALWAGLPVLTCTGETFAGRVATSLLAAIDLTDLVTAGLDAYETRAIELATHPTALTDIKAKLSKNRLTMPLFDTRAFTSNIEAAYTAMYERYRSGLPPDHMDFTAGEGALAVLPEPLGLPFKVV